MKAENTKTADVKIVDDDSLDSTVKIEDSDQKVDNFAVTWEDDENYVKWSDKTTNEKLKTVVVTTVKIILALGCLYIFICSISMLGDAFEILAGKTAGEIFSNDSFLANPLSGLIVGILVTVLVQSSSTSTSIVITMVAAGILQVHIAIPIIMGTNIGTSVTNTIVALSQSIDKNEFRRAFAGATVHDMFNLLSVLVFLPLEVVSGYLEVTTQAIIDSFHIQGGSDAPDMLTILTDPVVEGIVQINKSVITLSAQGIPLEPDSSMIKIWCDQTTAEINSTILTNTSVPIGVTTWPNASTTIVPMNLTMIETVYVGIRKCKSPQDFLFANTGLSDVEAGVILLFVSLFILSSCLIVMVKLLSSMLHGPASRLIKKVINTKFKRPFGWVTGYLSILVGAGLTFVVQSSSVFTSILTPLVGIGVISVERMYPLTLGANIGTTTTGIFTALASEPERLEYSLQLALVHLFFNISGILLWYPIPLMRRVPIRGAKALGNITADYRWFAVLYMISVFFLIPAILLGLSFANFWALMSVVIVVAVIAVFVVITNIMQTHKPQWLPEILRNWLFLPVWMRSLQPYDKFFSKYLLCRCCCKPKDDEESIISSSVETPSGNDNTAFEADEIKQEFTGTKM
uniref:sodium-dependent phosphate transport protein 2B-like n=1 Tax=Ciona intestinalis TaxID=7719 RepID=UPI000180CC8A|nr:sodium-dependent phosphate transport protein 2B-like [Ciona intestinalis]|eukprot:XP_002121031.1 sodium-dependent phosphate transport protein 2B-like [Ciona intestinalis]